MERARSLVGKPIGEFTLGVTEQARAWQSRPLDPFYGIVFLDALYGQIHFALGIDLEGWKDVLGLWISSSASPKLSLQALAELRERGANDIYLICMDGLQGFPPGIESIYPKAGVQLSIAHLVRSSLSYVTWVDRDKVLADLAPIYKAETAGEADLRLRHFGAKWPKYPAIARLWREQWERVIPFFAFPEEVRKVVCATRAVDSLHKSLLKVVKTHGSFSSEEAAMTLLYPALRRVAAKSERLRYWKQMLNYLDTACADRIREAGAWR